MRMNSKMAELLDNLEIDLSNPLNVMTTCSPPELVSAEESIFLQDEYAGAKHLSLSDFQDRTGHECFVNHVHFAVSDDKATKMRIIGYSLTLQKLLQPLSTGRKFSIIVSVADQTGTVRFHQFRPSEPWLAEDLEGYEEAVLEISTIEYVSEGREAAA